VFGFFCRSINNFKSFPYRIRLDTRKSTLLYRSISIRFIVRRWCIMAVKGGDERNENKFVFSSSLVSLSYHHGPKCSTSMEITMTLCMCVSSDALSGALLGLSMVTFFLEMSSLIFKIDDYLNFNIIRSTSLYVCLDLYSRQAAKYSLVWICSKQTLIKLGRMRRAH
jgi:hypothetical protein